jgi:alkylation response protein AidB-like acyl-CoA dehydrogenase
MVPRNPWLRASLAAWSLGVEASTVIVLRTMKIAAGGPAAEAEVQQMISEKIEAGLDLQTMAMTGGLGFTPESATNKTLAHYRRKVRANRRRLIRE